MKIKRSLFEKTQGLADIRDIALNVNLFFSDLNEVFRCAELVAELFINSFNEKEFLLLTGTDNKSKCSSSKCLEYFKSEMKRGYGSLFYDGIKKNTVIETKKDYQRWLYSSCSADIMDINVEIEEKIVKRGLDDKVKIKKILEKNYSDEHYLKNIYKSDFALLFSTYEAEQMKDIYIGELEFCVSYDSLGDEINECAEELFNICKKMCKEFYVSNGYVTTSYCRINKYISPTMNYFDNFYEKEVNNEHLVYSYAEGLEWKNIMSAHVASKISHLDLLKKNEDIEITESKEGCLIIESRHPILEHKAKMYMPFYNTLKRCLRPGYSVVEISWLRKDNEDIYIPEDEYSVDGEKVIFRRGY